MIPIRAKRILKELRDEESGSLSIAELETRTGFSYQKVRNLCDCLIDMGLVQRGTPKEDIDLFILSMPERIFLQGASLSRFLFLLRRRSLFC